MYRSNPQQRYERAAGEDYCSYVSRLEKTTSMIDGPHFPNLRREAYEPVADRLMGATVGRFGVAMHLHDPSSFRAQVTNTEEDVDRESGEFIRRRHQVVTYKGAA